MMGIFRRMKIWSFGREFFGAPMPSCRQVAEYLDDYTDGQLPRGRMIMFKIHLLLCPDCRRYLASYRRTREMLGKVTPLPMPPATAERLEALLVRHFQS